MNEIRRIVESSGKPLREIAAEVFPSHRHPARVLNRIMGGKQDASVDDLLRLCRACNVSAEEVIGRWRVSYDEAKLVFTKGNIVAEVVGNNVKVYEGGALVYDQRCPSLNDSYVCEFEKVLETIIHPKNI